MTAKPAFDFVTLPDARSTRKPRRSGLTSLIDYGIPLRAQSDMLETSGHLIDIAKIATATARIHDEKILVSKLESYQSHDVHTQMGGQFAEYVYATQGLAGVRQLFTEARRLGFEIVEISDTCRPLDHTERKALVDTAKDADLRVVCEVGLYEGNTDKQKIIEDIELALQLGVERVIVEGAELVDADGFRKDVVDFIKSSVNVEQLMFELPGPGISDASPAKLESLKRGLVIAFGPDTNIGNLLPDEIMETELVRVGIEDCQAWPEPQKRL